MLVYLNITQKTKKSILPRVANAWPKKNRRDKEAEKRGEKRGEKGAEKTSEKKEANKKKPPVKIFGEKRKALASTSHDARL